MRVPVLIFDFGNVIAFFDYLRAWEKFGHVVALTGPELRELLEHRGLAELHRRFETGGMAPEEFAVSLMAMGGFELTVCGVRHHLGGHLPAQRAGGSVDRMPQVERIYSPAGFEHERDSLDLLPPPSSCRPSTSSIGWCSRTRSVT